MSAAIIKFPKVARFRTRAQQIKLNKAFKRIKAGEPDMPDSRAFKLAVLFIRIEERSAQLHREEHTTAPPKRMKALATAASSAMHTAKAAMARSMG